MVDQGPQGFYGPTGPVNDQGVVAPPKIVQRPQPAQGAQGFQGASGPVNFNGIIDQSPAEGFVNPPTIGTHPTGINVNTPRLAGDLSPTSLYAPSLYEPVPKGPQGAQGLATEENTLATPHFGLTQNQITAMQATQRAMEVLNVSPNLKTHPDIVAALAYNTSIPWTPQTLGLIGAVQKARSAVNYASQFTMADYNQTAKLVNPQAYHDETFAERIGRGLDMEGRGINDLFPWLRPIEHAVSWEVGGTASNAATLLRGAGNFAQRSVADRTETLPQDLLDKGYSIKKLPDGTVDLVDKNGKQLDEKTRGHLSRWPYYIPSPKGTDGQFLGAVPGSPNQYLVKASPIIKSVVNFVADQFDTPEHLYRYIATVEHKHGAGMAALALLPTVAGAVIGTALGGVGGSEGAAAGVALDEAFANTVTSEGLSDLAAATLAKRDLSLMEERAATLVAQRAARVGNVAGQLGRIVTAPVNLAAKVATSPISLGADVGFTGGGQVIYRQDYMDSRNGTTWAKKYPMLASTFGRFATQNMDPGGWKTFLSGSLDAIAAVAVPDALGSAGRVVGIARSAEGFTGGLLSGKYKDTGNWFGNVYDKYGGLSRSGDGHLRIGGIYKTGLRLSNVDAFYNESAGARRTVNLIAQMGNAGEIIGVDARFAPIADLLAKARVVEADGTVNMTKSVENVKQVLRDSQTAAELMERPLAMASMPITANSIYRAIREGAKGVTPGFAEGLFSPLPIYADSKTLRMENREFTVGNRDALPAIRDMIGSQYGYGVANQVIDELANNLDPHFWQQTIVNTVGGQMAKEVAHSLSKIKLPDNIAKAVLEEYDKIIPEKLRQVFNFGGPHQQGSYGYAVFTDKSGLGANLSLIKERTQKAEKEVAGPADIPEDLFGGNHKLTDVVNPLTERTIGAAIVPEELGKMHLPSYLEIQRVNRQFAEMLQERYKDAINVAPDIEKLTGKIANLTKKRIAALSDPEAVAKFDKQIENAKKLLAIKQQIGADTPKEMPNFGYGVFKKGLAAGSNTYDFIDHYYNNMFFKRLALATGGWAMRTGMSEASLNIFRQGPLNYTAAKLAASVARHERAVLHIGEKFTRQAAEDIAARIYHLIREDGMLGPNGAVFTSEAEAYAAVANVRKVANEANLYLSISDRQIVGAIQSEEGDMNSFLTSRKVSAAYRGFMVGAKSQILKQLNKQDLLDAAIRLMYLNDGHIVSPMLNATHAGIAQDLQTGSSTEDNVNIASWKNPFITNNKTLQKAKLSKDFQGIEGISERYAETLQTRSQWMGKSKIYAPTFVAYDAEYNKAKEALLAAGETEVEASKQAGNIAAERIRPVVKKLLDEKLTDAEKGAMLRTTHPLPDESLFSSKLNPHYSGLSEEEHAALTDKEHAAIDHVTAVIQAARGHVTFIGGSANEPLLSSMAKGEIPSDLGEFKKQMMTIDGKPIGVGNFNLIPGPELNYANYSWAEKVLNNSVGKLSNSMHKKVLGPIVNRLTRDPIYIVDFAAERKLLNAKVTAGEMTRDEADTIAQVRASVNAMRYIHNPKNKLKFENMMRLWSPFYFAENQAWRRLGRLAWTNPGAAEQYTKAMYQTQQVLYQENQKTNNISITIPGSAWLNKQFFGVDIPFEVSPNSLRTVFPWSAESGQAPGIGSLIGSFLPKAGPILSIPSNYYLQKEAGLLPGLDKFLGNYVVGQAGVGQPMLLGIFPNSIMANIVKGAIGWFNSRDKNELSQNALSTASSSYISANIMVQTALLDAKQQEAWKKHKDDPLPSDWAAAGATQHEHAMYGMMNDIEQQFHSPEQRQAFLDSANFKTTEIFALKTLVGGAAPLSVLLGRSNVQYSQEFQADLTATGSVLQAANMFLTKHPDLTAETLFTTTATSDKALGVAWPTTPGTADFMLAHKDDITKYPAVMRFALQEGPQLKGKKGYDQMAHFIQTSWGLRAQKTPTGFLNSYLDSVFNQFHYGVLQPMGQELIKQGYSFNEVNNSLLHNSTTWKSRENNPNEWSMLEKFGKTVAPLAFSNYLQGNSEINRSNALQQLREVIDQPSMLAKYENFRDIKDILMPAADQLIAYKAEASKSGDSAYRDQLALQWNSELDRVAAAKPNLLPVIQQIFRPLAPIFTN